MELLEREQPLQDLRDALRAAVAGSGRIVLIEGEAGIGKTALIGRFTRALRTSTRVLWGACDDLFTPRPLGPFADIATQVGGALPALLEAPERWAALCSTMLVELQNHPTIAVFEDLHWADEATLDLLRYLGRRIERTSALVVLTYRVDEFGPRHPLLSTLTELRATPGCRALTLRPLSQAAIEVMLLKAGQGAPLWDAVELHRRTGGNPFFVSELIANPIDALPTTVRDVILARAANLPGEAHTALQAAAVVGLRCEPELLQAVLGALGSSDPVAELGACVSVGMLVRQGAHLAFSHEVARQAILDSISPIRRRVLHQHVLQALRAEPGPATSLARLAHHAEGAADREAIRLYAPTAAREAVAARMHRAAARLYALALEHSAELPQVERAELLLAYSVECDVTDRRPEAIEAAEAARTLFAAAGKPLGEGQSLNRLSLLLQVVGRRAEAETANRAALDLLEPLAPNRELISAYNVAAWLSLSEADPMQGIAMVDKALALVEHFESEAELPRLYEIAGLLWLTRDHARGQAFLERALSEALRLDHATRAGNIYANLSLITVDFHQFDKAEALFSVGLPHAREHDLDFAGAVMTGYQALLSVHRGDWVLAERLALGALERGPASPGRGPALLALGRLRARRGDGTAFEALDEALDLLLRLGFRQLEGLVRAARAEAAWGLGDLERTRNEALAVFDLAVDHRHPWYVGELAYWLWRADAPIAALPAWTARPYMLQIEGQWRAAAEAWAAMGCPYEQARALADGDAEARFAALTVFNRLGARSAAQGLRDPLRDIGQRVPRGPRATTRSHRFGLTARQSEILDLIVTGLSNPEIAARLQLSPKTVDHHVSAILARLGVSSRSEAARLAQAQGSGGTAA